MLAASISPSTVKGSSLAGRKILYLHLPVAPGTRETQVATRNASVRKSAASKTATQKTVGRGGSPLRHPAGSKTEQASAVVHAAVKHHKVKPGETLYSIANSYNTTVSALKHDNRDIATLRPGMILIVRDTR